METNNIIVNSVTGITGGGKNPNVKFHYPNMNENLFAYGIASHRHRPEMEQIASEIAEKLVQMLFQPHAGPFDPILLAHPWAHRDAHIDNLAEQAMALVEAQSEHGASRREIFGRLCELADVESRPLESASARPRATIPYLDEPWYC